MVERKFNNKLIEGDRLKEVVYIKPEHLLLALALLLSSINLNGKPSRSNRNYGDKNNPEIRNNYGMEVSNNVKPTAMQIVSFIFIFFNYHI